MSVGKLSGFVQAIHETTASIQANDRIMVLFQRQDPHYIPANADKITTACVEDYEVVGDAPRIDPEYDCIEKEEATEAAKKVANDEVVQSLAPTLKRQAWEMVRPTLVRTGVFAGTTAVDVAAVYPFASDAKTSLGESPVLTGKETLALASVCTAANLSGKTVIEVVNVARFGYAALTVITLPRSAIKAVGYGATGGIAKLLLGNDFGLLAESWKAALNMREHAKVLVPAVEGVAVHYFGKRIIRGVASLGQASPAVSHVVATALQEPLETLEGNERLAGTPRSTLEQVKDTVCSMATLASCAQVMAVADLATGLASVWVAPWFGAAKIVQGLGVLALSEIRKPLERAAVGVAKQTINNVGKQFSAVKGVPSIAPIPYGAYVAQDDYDIDIDG